MSNLIFQYLGLKISSSMEVLIGWEMYTSLCGSILTEKDPFMTYSCNKFEVIKKYPLGLFCFCLILATMNTIVKRIDFGARPIRIKF